MVDYLGRRETLPAGQQSEWQRRYWNRVAGERDQIPSLIRNRPVPAMDLPNMTHISAQDKLELGVEALAMYDEFVPQTRIDNIGFYYADTPEQTIGLNRLTNEVMSAPPEKQESAKQNLVDQLGVAAKWFGRNTWGATKTIGDAITPDWLGPAAKQTGIKAMHAFAWSGEEVTAEWLYAVQQAIPGDQKFERRVRAHREFKYKDRPLPWWRKLPMLQGKREAGMGFGTGEFAPTGGMEFDVPMGVHLPMEILLDPLNFIPIGGAWKAARMLMHANEGFAFAKAASQMTKAVSKANPGFKGNPTFAEFLAKSNENDELMQDWAIRQAYFDSGINPDPWSFRITDDGDVLYEKSTVGAARRKGEGPPTGEEPGPASLKFDAPTSQDAEDLPVIRGIPGNIAGRGGKSALREIAESPDLLESPFEVNSWVMQVLYHTGIRPNELQNIKIGDLETQMSGQFINPVLPMDIVGKQNDRLLYNGQRGEAYKVLTNWVKRRGELTGGTQHPDDKAFWVIVQNKKGEYVREEATAANINKVFEEAAKRYGATELYEDTGAELLKFYGRREGTRLGNNNFSYVFRLDYAARTYAAGGQVSALDTSLGMGHSSIRNTARYLSALQMHDGDLKTAMNFFGWSGIDESVQLTPELLAPFSKGRKKLIPHPQGELKPDDHPAEVTRQRAHQIIQDARTKFIVDNVKADKTLNARLPEGLSDEAATLWGKLETLGSYVDYMQQLYMAKVVIGRAKFVTPEAKKEASTFRGALNSWRFAHIQAGRDLIASLKEAPDPTNKINDSLLSLLQQPFLREEYNIINIDLEAERFAGMGRGSGKPTLADLLPEDAIIAAERTPAGTTPGTRTYPSPENPLGGAEKQALAHRVARLTQDQVNAANQELTETGKITLGTRTYTREELAKNNLLTEATEDSPGGLLRDKDPRFAEGTTKDLELNVGYVLVRKGPIPDPLNPGSTKIDRSTYILTEWIRHPETGDITHARIEKLASEGVNSEGLIVLAKFPTEEMVPVSEMTKWANTLEVPISMNPASGMFGELGRSGPRTLTPRQIAEMLYMTKADENMELGIEAWRRALSPVAGDEEAIARGMDHLQHVPLADRITGRGTSRAVQTFTDEQTGLVVTGNDLVLARGSGRQRVYRWTDAVKNELAKLVEADPDGWGWATNNVDGVQTLFGRKGGIPGQPPGASPPAGGFPDGFNRMNFGDEGKPVGLNEVMQVPLAMDHPLQFTGTGLGARFFKLGEDGGVGPRLPGLGFLSDGPSQGFPWLGKLRAPRGAQKYMRMLVPGTFGTSEAGKLTATYRLALEQGKQIASDVAFHLQKSFDEAGLLEDDMLGRTIPLRVETVASGPGGVPHIAYAQHPVNKLRESLYTEFGARNARGIGPWTQEVISADRAKFNPQDMVRFVETFLTTAREDLNKYYVMDGPNGRALQKAYDHYHEVGPQLMKMFEAAGFDPKVIMKDARGEDITWRPNFVPAMTTSKWTREPDFGEIGKKQRKIGDAPTSFSDKWYEYTIEGKMRQGFSEGKTAHNVYEHDPILAITRQIEQYYQYVIDHQFTEKFLELGIDKSLMEQPNSIGRKIWALRHALPGDRDKSLLTDEDLKLAIKWYGKDWETMPIEVFQSRQRHYNEISAAGGELHLQKGLDYLVDSEKIKEAVAMHPEASRELAALGSDLIDPLNGFVRETSAIANTMRMMATGADFGVMLLHGFGAFGTMLSPTGLLPDIRKLMEEGKYEMALPLKARAAWAVGTTNMFRAVWNPEVRRNWYVSTAMERADMQKYGISFFRSTFTEDLPTPGVFTTKRDYPGKKTLAKPMEHVRSIIKRPVEGFGFFLDVSKTEMWRAWKTADMGENALQDLAASLNAIHGTINPNVAGMQHKQRVFESAFLLYAALYRRSALAMIKNLASTKKWRRGPALHAISGMMASGGALGFAIKELGYNDDVYDIGSPDFMAMKVGNMRIGIGTPYYTFMRMGHDIFDQVVKDGDVSGALELDVRDNKVLRWMRSQTSPVTAAASDLIDGKTFTGDPLRDTEGGWEVEKIGNRISRTLIPFWLESLIDPDTRGIKSSVSEFFGLRVSPQSPYGRMLAAQNFYLAYDTDPEVTTWRRSQEKKGLPTNVQSAPILLLRRLVDRHPDLQLIEQQMKKDIRQRGTEERKDQDKFIESMNENRIGKLNPETNMLEGGADQQLQGFAIKFENGEISGQEFQKQVRLVEAWLRGANQEVAGQYQDVIDRFEERRTDRVDNPADQFVFDLQYDEYRETVTNGDDLHDAYGNFDVTRYIERKDAYRALVGEKAWAYIEARGKEGRLLPGAVKDLYEARETLQDYWNLHEKIWGPRSGEVRLLDEWRTLGTQSAKNGFALKYPGINNLLWKLDWEQDKFRRQRPDIDALLVRFYDYRPMTSAGTVIANRRDAQGLRIAQNTTISDRLEALSP